MVIPVVIQAAYWAVLFGGYKPYIYTKEVMPAYF